MLRAQHFPKNGKQIATHHNVGIQIHPTAVPRERLSLIDGARLARNWDLNDVHDETGCLQTWDMCAAHGHRRILARIRSHYDLNSMTSFQRFLRGDCVETAADPTLFVATGYYYSEHD
jgi:hypothetical protein